MTSYSGRKVVIGHYWKRPKAKLYECNLRDAERLYQDTYKDYLRSKESAANRKNSNAEEQSINQLINLRRSSSLTKEDDDYSIGRSSIAKEDEKFRVSSSTGPSVTRSTRASSTSGLREMSPDSELSSIDQRLARLRKLREELGLPAEIGQQNLFNSGSSTAESRSLTNATYSRQQSPGLYGETRGRSSAKGSDRFKSSSVSRVSSRSRAHQLDRYEDSRTPRLNAQSHGVNSAFETTYSAKTSSSVGARKASAEQKENAYAPKSILKKTSRYGETSESNNYYMGDEASRAKKIAEATANSLDEFDRKFARRTFAKKGSKYESTVDSQYGGSSKGSASVDLDGVCDFDEDEFLANIRKKFPSSQEILERIKKMDSEL